MEKSEMERIDIVKLTTEYLEKYDEKKDEI
jgi:hypothetical protein